MTRKQTINLLLVVILLTQTFIGLAATSTGVSASSTSFNPSSGGAHMGPLAGGSSLGSSSSSSAAGGGGSGVAGGGASKATAVTSASSSAAAPAINIDADALKKAFNKTLSFATKALFLQISGLSWNNLVTSWWSISDSVVKSSAPDINDKVAIDNCIAEAKVKSTLASIFDPNNEKAYNTVGSYNKFDPLVKSARCAIPIKDQRDLRREWYYDIIHKHNLASGDLLAYKNCAGYTAMADDSVLAQVDQAGSKGLPAEKGCQLTNDKAQNLFYRFRDNVKVVFEQGLINKGKAKGKDTLDFISNNQNSANLFQIWLDRKYTWSSECFKQNYKHYKDMPLGARIVLAAGATQMSIESPKDCTGSSCAVSPCLLPTDKKERLASAGSYAQDMLQIFRQALYFHFLDDPRFKGTKGAEFSLYKPLVAELMPDDQSMTYLPFKFSHGIHNKCIWPYTYSGCWNKFRFDDRGDGPTTFRDNGAENNIEKTKTYKYRQRKHGAYYASVDSYVKAVNSGRAKSNLILDFVSRQIANARSATNMLTLGTWRLDKSLGAQWMNLVKNGYPSQVKRQELLVLTEIRSQLAMNQKTMQDMLQALTLVIYNDFQKSESDKSVTSLNITPTIDDYARGMSSSDANAGAAKKQANERSSAGSPTDMDSIMGPVNNSANTEDLDSDD